MQNIDYTALYAENADFKRYVDRYCVKHRISVAEALQHYLVQMAGRQVQGAGRNDNKEGIRTWEISIHYLIYTRCKPCRYLQRYV